MDVDEDQFCEEDSEDIIVDEGKVEIVAATINRHRWSEMLGGCYGGTCEWEGNHDENEYRDHSAHVALEIVQNLSHKN